MNNRGNVLEFRNLLLRNEVFQEIFNKTEEKYITTSYLELLEIFNNHIKIIKEDNETKYLCIKNLNNYIKKYNLSEKMRISINQFINNLYLIL